MSEELWDTRDNISQSVTVGSNRFEVTHFKGCSEYGNGQHGPYIEYWELNLPHQCDDFDVAFSRVSHDDAVKQMEGFVAEAKLALEALKGMA